MVMARSGKFIALYIRFFENFCHLFASSELFHMMLVDQDFASQSCWMLENCKKVSMNFCLKLVCGICGWTGGKKLMLRQNSSTFEEHLVSLSFANCAVNTSLTTSRAHFHKRSIWPGCPQRGRGKPCPAVAHRVPRLTLPRCSICGKPRSQGWCIPSPYPLPYPYPHPYPGLLVRAGSGAAPAEDSAAPDAEVCVV